MEIRDAEIYRPEDQSRLPLSVEALVYDKQTGDRICHAEVRLKGEGIDVEKRLTEKKCVAKFDDVKIKPGIYTLQVEAEGYNPVTRTDHLEEGTYRYTVKLAPEKAKWLIQTLKNPVFWIVLIGILLVIALAIRIYHYRIMG
ncbi:MAG: hypothetical protein DRO11_09955 [Methanobacteriota archaeon]|nr:MAG: hypothetical protein DRO11_09955 [Euryarchaeota archaeon]